MLNNQLNTMTAAPYPCITEGSSMEVISDKDYPSPHWSNELIRDTYDGDSDMSLGDLAIITGKPRGELVAILMGGSHAT